MFGQPFKQFECPEYVEAALGHIRNEVVRVLWNLHQEEIDPFGNTGQKHKNAVFEVEAYDWGEDIQPYNFKWRDLEISWYKYLGRGMSMNRETSPDEMAEMIEECLAAMRKQDTAI